MAWNVEERARLWLEACVYHCQDGTFLFLLIPLNRRPGTVPNANIDCLDRHGTNEKQNELLQHWGEQGYKVIFHAPNFTFIPPLRQNLII